ncbi:MAG TPA: efflux RND transporter permease subunit, partial [Myxococcales bacterium]
MMWLVRMALKRPYTFVVMSMLIVIVGVLTILRMPKDIFPDIDIPVISVVFNYSGLQPDDMERRIVSNYERALTTTVNDIEHIESQSLTGVAVIKIFFQPGAKIEAATAQVTAISQAATRSMPPGTTPPFIIRYSASNVPILQVALESQQLSEQQLFDFGINFIRPDLTTIQGAQLPYPYGGKQRLIMIDIDPQRLFAWGLSPRDVNNAVANQNVIVPTGTAKIGLNEYPIVLNSSPDLLSQLESIPVKVVRGTTVYVRDVAHVRDGYSPQTNIVHVEGQRSVLMSILKQGSASTLDVVRRIRDVLPGTLSRLPKELKVSLLFDQSVFVRASIEGVVKEAGIAAALTALMLLIFLGSWRSTFIVLVSIPLSILVAIIVLAALGETLNVMTLGGMALAVGILVDDATVEIENVHRNMAQKKPILRAILDGAREIATPALVSTLCICIVFVPVGFITGAARSLFVPLAMSVVFAMLTSYFLSRTLVPTMMHYLMAAEAQRHLEGHDEKPKNAWGHFITRFEAGFARLRDRYGGMLAWTLQHRRAFVLCFLGFVVASVSLLPLLGRDFFPTVDAGLIKLHVRGVPGTRIEETERKFVQIEDAIRTVIPPEHIETLLDNIGIPYSGLNLSLSEGALISPADGEIFIALKKDHPATAPYVRKIRETLAQRFPEDTFFFLAPDISTQVLNFGLPAPIDVQIVGAVGNEGANYAVAKDIATKVAAVPGAVDVHLAQVPSQPELRIDVNRTMAGQVGLTEKDVASDLLVSLASSQVVQPTYWLDKRGVQYLVAVQTPQRDIDSINALAASPISNGSEQPQLLSNMAAITRTEGPVNITHYNIARTYDVQANVDGTDLGSVADKVTHIVDQM